MRCLTTRLIAAVAVVAFATANSHAEYTTVLDSGETTVAEILDVLYGDGSIDGNNNAFEGWSTLQGAFTYNNITITRVHDRRNGGTLGSNLDFAGGQTLDESVNDQIWEDGIASGQGEAKYAGFSQKFGYKPGASGATYTNLFDLSGNGFNVSGSFTGLSFSNPLRWARDGQGSQMSSLESDNDPDGDQMITFKIEGLTGGAYDTAHAVWIVFFEDKDGNEGSDWDFNDLVVEIIAVPLPAPLALAGLGLLGVAAGRKRLRRLVS
jgi:hypothetical protein